MGGYNIVYFTKCSCASMHTTSKCKHRYYRIGGSFRQEKIFANFATCCCWRNFLSTNFLSRVNDYIEDMVTFTALAKIIPPNISVIQK